jgi:hypothetical protein
MSTEEKAAVYVDLKELKPWHKNPRINTAAVEKVEMSIRRFGFAAPIIARKSDNMIIAGHTRWKALHNITEYMTGDKKVPVRFMDVTREEAEKLALADNKLNEVALWDQEKLTDIIKDFNSEELNIVGFTDDEINKLLNDNDDYSDNFVDDDHDYGVVEPQGRAGNIVQIVLWYDEEESNLFRDYIKKIKLDNEGTNSEIILELLKNEYYKTT